VRASVGALLLALLLVPAASAAPPSLQFTLFAQTDLPLGQVTWTGSQWLYVAENLGQIEAAAADGTGAHPFASVAQGGEEMRCALPPNRYWVAGVYCHTPDNRILRFSLDGSQVTLLAQLPASTPSDGALAFDGVGRFGYALLAATGGSGTSGGDLYAVREDGRVQRLGSYPGPGGADEIAVAPASFGSAAGWCLLAIDQDSTSGRLLALDRHGTLKTIASGLGTGANPLVVVQPAPKARPAGAPPAGLYLADTASQQVWFSSASGFAGLAGSVLVGTELGAQLWVVRPSGGGFSVEPVRTDLPQRAWNLEGSAYVP